MKKTLVVVLSVPLLLLVFSGMAMAADQDSLIVSFPVIGNPQYVAVESPSSIWYTVPDQDLVGHLVVTSTTDYEVVTYTSTIAEPYDIAFASGYVWFTGQGEAAVGRLDPSDGSIDEFPMTNPASHLAGIDVLPGSPVRVWAADAGAGALVELVVTSATNYTLNEYLLPATTFGADPQVSDLSIRNAGEVWFTVTNNASIGRLQTLLYPDRGFVRQATGTGTTPLSIDLDSAGDPWIIDNTGNQVGRFLAQTFADFVWYSIPSDNAGLRDVVTGSGYVWFTEQNSGKVGRIDPDLRRLHEHSLPGGHPTGLDVDSQGQAWIADATGARILTWRAPYFHHVFLPMVMRGA